MEDLKAPTGSPSLQNPNEPQANDDPNDPLNPNIDEENSALTPPLAQPTADTEAFEDEEAAMPAHNNHGGDEDELADEAPAADADDLEADDPDSELEELDEAEFADFDPSALQIPDKPVAVDAENVGLLGVHKRKRTEEEELARKKKKKEGRRAKPSRKRVRAGEDEDEEFFEGGVEIDGKRVRKPKAIAGERGAGGSKAGVREKRPVEVNEEELSPEERKSTPSHTYTFRRYTFHANMWFL